MNDELSKYNYNTMQTGKIGELSIIEKFISHNIPVYTPVVDAYGTDIIADINGTLLKIQVKSSASITESNSVSFQLSRSGTWRTSSGELHGQKMDYSTSDVDYFALYDINTDRAFMVKNHGKRSISVRYDTPCNNQSKTIHRADDYDFDTVVDLLSAGIDPDMIIYDDN